MQLHLEIDELNLLANILMERISTLSTQASAGSRKKSGAQSQPDTRQYNGLLDKVLARDLRFDSDELEQLADFLAAQKRELTSEFARQYHVTLRDELLRRLSLLERVLEKIDEACAMV